MPVPVLQYASAVFKYLRVSMTPTGLLAVGPRQMGPWAVIVFVPALLILGTIAVGISLETYENITWIIRRHYGLLYIWSPLFFAVAWIAFFLAMLGRALRFVSAAGKCQSLEIVGDRVILCTPFSHQIHHDFSISRVQSVEAFLTSRSWRGREYGCVVLSTDEARYELFFNLPFDEINELHSMILQKIPNLVELPASDMVGDR